MSLSGIVGGLAGLFVGSAPAEDSAENADNGADADEDVVEATFEPVHADSPPEVNGPTLCELTGELFRVADDGSVQSEIPAVRCLVKEDLDEPFSYVLELYSSESGAKLLMQPLDGDMNMLFSLSERSMQWFVEDTLRRLVADVDVSQFSDIFCEVMWQTVNQMPFKKTIPKKEDQDYYKGTMFVDYAMPDYSDEEEEEEEEREEVELLFGDRAHRYEGPDSRPDFFASHEPLERRNLCNLNVAYAMDRSFVTKGSDIAVMKTSENNKPINVISGSILLDDESFTPESTMLFGGDRSMMMVHPDDDKKDTLVQMSLERGTVVQTWQPGGGQKLRRIAPASKNKENNDPTFAGVSNNAVMRMDTRVDSRQGAVQKHVYSKSMGFSCIATNGAGNVAVGNDKGEIRLFTNPGDSRAKSSIPGLGDEITGIDVSEDGHWILATTPRYLMLINTWSSESGKTGFQKSVKPAPIKLSLSHQDVMKHGITKLRFTPAHFNVGEFKESLIVTSTGPYIVMWDMKKVRKKNLSAEERRAAYTIKRTKSEGVAEGPLFNYNASDRIVVNSGFEVFQEEISGTARNRTR